jgi:CRISPR/Cas system CSM-associated protein Csm3 (group 7 of RAMP superfamily)
MNKYKLEIEILSDTLIGSGEGFGAVIDTDIVFDKVGIPYIPSKRIKGLLRDSAAKVFEMLKAFDSFSSEDGNKLFGEPGNENSSPLKISDLYIEDYKNNYDWVEYFTESLKFKSLFSRESVADYFTNVRKSTTIDENGIAKKHSLRTARVLSKGFKFSGEIEIHSESKEFEKILAYAGLNLKAMGTKRNRGLGEIKCNIYKEKLNLTEKTLQELEAVC